MSELLDYLESLDEGKEENKGSDSNDHDDHDNVINTIKSKSENVINRWKHIEERLDKEILTTNGQMLERLVMFEKLDKLLIDIGYVGNSELIKKIRSFLRKQIDKMHVCQFNKVFETKIWNHYDLLEKSE